jgi:hypothetical protein
MVLWIISEDELASCQLVSAPHVHVTDRLDTVCGQSEDDVTSQMLYGWAGVV